MAPVTACGPVSGDQYIAPWATLAGQSVAPTARWLKIVGSVATALTGKLVFSPPADDKATVPLGFVWSRPSRQPTSRPSVCSWIGVGATSSKLLIIATLHLSRLNPPGWSPCNG